MGRCEDLPFLLVCDFFNSVTNRGGEDAATRMKPAAKYAIFRRFREQVVTGADPARPGVPQKGGPSAWKEGEKKPAPVPLAALGDPFQVYRLLLPRLDDERRVLGASAGVWGGCGAWRAPWAAHSLTHLLPSSPSLSR